MKTNSEGKSYTLFIIIVVAIIVIIGVIILSGLLNSNSNQVRIRVDYDGTWSGAYSSSSGSFFTWSGTGSKSVVLDRPEGVDDWTIAAEVMKTDYSDHTLTLTIETMNGRILKEVTTNTAFFPAQCVVEID
jgi:hypothetical protein